MPVTVRKTRCCASRSVPDGSWKACATEIASTSTTALTAGGSKRSRQSVNSFVSRHRAGVVLVALLALGMVMMILSHRPVAAASERIGRSVFSSLQLALHEVGAFFGGSWNTIAELRRMRAALEDARRRLLELEQLSSDMADLERLNAELRRQLGFAAPPTFRHLPAEVMARAPGNLFTNLTINRGTGDGVRADMVVVALQDGVQGLVGRVVEVDERSALVQPISARSSFVAAGCAISATMDWCRGSGRDPTPC